MGQLPAGLKAEASRGLAGDDELPELHVYLDLGPLPDGSTWRLSTHADCGPGLAPADARVLDWGSVRYAVDLYGHDPIPVEFSLELTDEGAAGDDGRRRFAMYAAKYRRRLRRTPAVLTVAGGGATHPLFTGILVNYPQVGPFRWRLIFRTDDSAINIEYGTSVPRVALATYFPNIHDDVRAYYAPIIYGKHDSNGAGNEGFVPCYLVDTVNNRYVVGLGHLKSVLAVYEDGEIIATTAYTIKHETIRGALFTLIDFGDQDEHGEITADVEGLTANPDGTGALLINGDQLQHFLVNFVWGDWRGGTAYLSTSTAPVDTASFTALDAFLDLMGHESSLLIGGSDQRKGGDVLREWLESHEAKAYWNNLNKLVVGIIDFRPPADPYAGEHFQANEDEEGLFETPNDETNITREVSAQFGRDSVSGDFKHSFRAQAIEVPEKVVHSVQLVNASSSTV